MKQYHYAGLVEYNRVCFIISIINPLSDWLSLIKERSIFPYFGANRGF